MNKLEERIAVVIVNYNDSDNTIKLCREIEHYSSIYKVIVVDNHSSDNSYLKIKSECSDEKFVVLQGDRNGGYGYGNNWGVKYARNELKCSYALIANPDVEFTSDCINHLREYMAGHHDCVIAAPVQRLHHANGIAVEGWELPTKPREILSSSILVSKLFKPRKYYNSGNCENEILKADVVQGALLMVDTDFFLRIGGYDEEIFLYNEEECLAQKVKREGKYSIILTNEIYIHHHSVSISKSLSSIAKRKKEMLKSKFIYINKYFKVSKAENVIIQLFFDVCCLESMIVSVVKRGR